MVENRLIKCGLAKPNNSWLGREVLFQTGEPLFAKELLKLEAEIEEIRQLLDPVDDVGS